MNETTIVRSILTWLRKQERSFAYKAKGDPRQQKGIPDIILCWDGAYFAFEVKVPGREKKVTDYQRHVLNKVKEAGGGAYVVTSLQEVKVILGEE